MDTGQDLINELNSVSNKMGLALKETQKRGHDYAEKERQYKMANAKFILAQRANGQPATLIKDLAMGDADVSLLRLQRDIAKVDYDNAKEAIMCYKLQINVLKDQVNQLWHSGNN